MVINLPKKTWLIHFYYNKTMVNFLKGVVLSLRILQRVLRKLKQVKAICFWDFATKSKSLLMQIESVVKKAK